jgi:hypothetical protein
MAPDPHTAVRQELLVRYLDFWVPAALHSGRAAIYLDRSRYGPAAALPVIGEFADLLAGRELTILVAGELPADPGLTGLRIAPAPPLADLPGLVTGLRRTPILAHLDGVVPEPVAGSLGQAHDGELLLVTPPESGDPRAALRAAGFGYVVAVELVDRSGTVQLLRFATSQRRSLERFKDELWAVDQYAGIRYRDPAEPEADPLEISYEPHPGPLRRAILSRLGATGPQTVTELRELALTRTLFRQADVGRALSPLLARGEVTREPARGRLTGTTQIRLPG